MGADKTAWREAKSNQKKEAAVGVQLMREITDPPNQTSFAIISDPTWRPSSPHLQPTWAAQPGRKCGGDHSTAAAAADPEDPKRPLVRGPAAASHAAEDPKRALVHALQKDICALKSDMSSRMSVLLERLDELLQLQAHEDRHESAWATQT